MSTVVLFCWCHSDGVSVLLYFTLNIPLYFLDFACDILYQQSYRKPSASALFEFSLRSLNIPLLNFGVIFHQILFLVGVHISYVIFRASRTEILNNVTKSLDEHMYTIHFESQNFSVIF